MLFVSMLYAIGICIGDALYPPFLLLFPVTILLWACFEKTDTEMRGGSWVIGF